MTALRSLPVASDSTAEAPSAHRRAGSLWRPAPRPVEAPSPAIPTVVDRRGQRRSPVTMPGYGAGKPNAYKGERYPVETLTVAEMSALLSACRQRRGLGTRRDHALIVLLWRSGLRISEALALLPQDVDVEAGLITVHAGKGGKRRVVALDPGACAAVGAWMQVRSGLELVVGATLFCVISKPLPGTPLGAAQFRDSLHRLAHRAGITKRVHPHGLRHTMAFELAQEGVPLPVISRQLGHSSMVITERYVNHLSPAQLTTAIHARAFPASAGPPAVPEPAPQVDPAGGKLLNVKAVADWLDLHPDTVQRLAGEGRIRGALKVGREWRFNPSEVCVVATYAGRVAAADHRRAILEELRRRGGHCTQRELRQSLGFTERSLFGYLRTLSELGEVERAGLGARQSVIWRLRPKPQTTSSNGSTAGNVRFTPTGLR